ncbi:unnamed protein product [Cyclocybe aegerita]|uniref:F-box domain-containing protein n=1 Tax=Cyclocybe aegerita TaxID=1973307 RepID=A0A8S0X0Z1_CYCAE|nr:unnamed protein product [Cyclocybe aegerita]
MTRSQASYPWKYRNTFFLFASPKDEKTIFTLASVCRGWQTLAWSTTALWTLICIDLDYVRDASLYEDILHRWLQRAGRQPLDIYLNIQYCADYDWEKERLCSSVVNIINQHMHRCAGLTLTIPLRLLNLFKHDADDIGHELPLHRLSIKPAFREESSAGSVSHFDMNQAIMPAPGTVSLMDCPFQNIHIDWRNVTRVNIDSFRVWECLRLLESAPQLHECTFKNLHEVDNINGLPYPKEPIIHNRLGKMEIDRLVYRYSSYGERFDALTPFLLRSACPIKFLSILETEDEDDDPVGLFDVLWSVPTLEALELHSIHLEDDFFQLLGLEGIPQAAHVVRGNEQWDFLPRLQSVHFSVFSQRLTFSWPVLYHSLSTRIACRRTEDDCPILRQFNMDLSVEKNREGHYIDQAGVDAFQRIINEDFTWRKGEKVQIYEQINSFSTTPLVRSFLVTSIFPRQRIRGAKGARSRKAL